MKLLSSSMNANSNPAVAPARDDEGLCGEYGNADFDSRRRNGRGIRSDSAGLSVHAEIFRSRIERGRVKE